MLGGGWNGDDGVGCKMKASEEIVRLIPVSKLERNPWGLEVGPPLSDEDYDSLEASIRRKGVQIPLIAWKKGKRLIVLSGSIACESPRS